MDGHRFDITGSLESTSSFIHPEEGILDIGENMIMHGISGLHMMSKYDRFNINGDFTDNTNSSQTKLLKNGYISISKAVSAIVSTLNKYEKARVLAKNAVLLVLTLSALKGIESTALLNDSKQVESAATYAARITPESIKEDEALLKAFKVTSKEEALSTLSDISTDEALGTFTESLPDENLKATKEITEAALRTEEKTGELLTETQANKITKKVLESDDELVISDDFVEEVVQGVVGLRVDLLADGVGDVAAHEGSVHHVVGAGLLNRDG